MEYKILMKHTKRSKIIATLGPASSNEDMILNMAKAGVDVFRLNFSHGSHAQHKENIERIRRTEKILGHPLGILADLQGPKLRIGMVTKKTPEEKIILEKGHSFTFTLDEVEGDRTHVTLPHPEIFEAAKIGTILLINDGLVKVQVSEQSQNTLHCLILEGGEISSRKGVNVPGVRLPLCPITHKDEEDLGFILTESVDWIALSFVQEARDILSLRQKIASREKICSPKIIAKLEKPLALKHLREIVEASDAVMVARGDLGVELALEEVPAAQRKIIHACRALGKPVIVATQMLESMVHNASPTRAEVSDVAGAIFDEVDAVMLSAESASGEHPLGAVHMMARIIHQAEKEKIIHEVVSPKHRATISEAITAAAREITHHLRIPVIVTITDSGQTTLEAAKERPHAALLALTKSIHTARELCLCWGAYAVVLENYFDNVLPSKDMTQMAIALAKKHHFAQKGDTIIITSGVPFQEGSTHSLYVVAVS